MTQDPAVEGKKGIKITYAGTETALQLGVLTAVQLFNANVSLPTTQGLFVRGWADGSEYDPDRDTRTQIAGTIAANGGDNVGSFQQDQNKFHNHPFLHTGGTGDASPAKFVTTEVSDTFGPDTGSLEPNGGNQANPTNVYMKFVINY